LCRLAQEYEAATEWHKRHRMQFARASIRRVLGSSTMRVLDLK